MKIISAIILSLLYLSSYSQKGIPGIDYRQCSTSERNNEILENNPFKKQLMEDAHERALKWTEEHYGEVNFDENGKKVVSYIIPVVWHVIHNGGQENISRAIIEDEIAELNKDFQKLNTNIVNVHPNFSSIAADCEIEFRLARLDPDGNCTEGITRTKSTLTYAMDESAKFLPGAESWNRNGRYYLNIWMGISLDNGAGGYAYYPGSVGMDQDGLVLRYQQLGNTVTHEVGHWLNLAHLTTILLISSSKKIQFRFILNYLALISCRFNRFRQLNISILFIFINLFVLILSTIKSIISSHSTTLTLLQRHIFKY